MSTVVIVRCIACPATKRIDEAESKRLSASISVPMCDTCGMPMLAISATRTPVTPQGQETGR